MAGRARGWQDIEAMAALDTAPARYAIRDSREDPDPAVRAAVLRHGAALLSEEERTALLVEGWHPAPVIDALAMLMFLHGRATSAFDWEQRPFFLRFNTEDPAQRAEVYRELCERLGHN